MKKSILIILMLCISFTAVSPVYAVPQSLRNAGIVDGSGGLFDNTFSVVNTIRKNNAYASALPAEMVYRAKREISEMYIAVKGGVIKDSFEVYTSQDSVTYENISETAVCETLKTDSGMQTVYKFNVFDPTHRYVKIQFLNTDVRIESIFINSPFTNPEIFEGGKDMNNGKKDRIITQEDVDIYKERIRTRFISNATQVPSVLATLNESGSWDDITYDGSEASKAGTHIERVASIAAAVSCPDNEIFEDKSAVAKLEKAIDFWVKKDIVFDNWYYNDILNPQNMGKTLITSGYLLSDEVRKDAEEFLWSKISQFDTYDRDQGSNLVNKQLGRIYYAVHMNDFERLKSAFDRIADETTMVTKFGAEGSWRDNNWRSYVNIPDLPPTRGGIQVDYSVLFHGPELLSGQYGLVNVDLITDILVDTDGTDLFPKDGLDDFINHILEHVVWILRGPQVDHNTRGRGVAQNDVGAASWVYENIEKLGKLTDIPRLDEIKAYNEAMIEKSPELAVENYKIMSVEVSSEPQPENNASNLIDGNLSTRWSTDEIGAVATFDLGEEKQIGTIGLVFHSGDARRTLFDMEISTDNANWTNVFAGKETGSSGKTAEMEYYVFAPKKARYIKLTGYGNSNNSAWTSIDEINAYPTVDVENVEENGIEFNLLDDFGNLKRYTTKPPLPNTGVTGNRYYWKGDYTAHQQKNFMLGIRAASKRTIGSEQTNTENTLGNYLGHGATFIYRDGMEYYDIFAAYDWCKIPGTTSQIQEFVPVMIQSNMFPGSKSDCTGGVSDGDYGAMAYQFDLDGLRAKKAWFMFDNEFVALGTDISNSTPNKHITTVNQNLLRSDVTVSENGIKTKVLSEGADQSHTVKWVHQDETGYFFPDSTPVKISVEPNKEGDRTAINYNGAYSRPTTPQLVYRDVFTLWFDHSNTATKEDYEYIVIPQIKAEDMSSRNPGEYIHTLSNTSILQAVENTKLNVTQAVFWASGSLKTTGGMEISVSQPALIQIRENDGKLICAVASINAKDDSVTVRISRELSGDGVSSDNGVSEFTVQLPSGDYAGQSVIKTFDTE